MLLWEKLKYKFKKLFRKGMNSRATGICLVGRMGERGAQVADHNVGNSPKRLHLIRVRAQI